MSNTMEIALGSKKFLLTSLDYVESNGSIGLEPQQQQDCPAGWQKELIQGGPKFQCISGGGQPPVEAINPPIQALPTPTRVQVGVVERPVQSPSTPTSETDAGFGGIVVVGFIAMLAWAGYEVSQARNRYIEQRTKEEKEKAEKKAAAAAKKQEKGK